MEEHGIKVLADGPPAAPDELIAAWLDERLVVDENACDRHGDGRYHHDDQHHHDEDCHYAR